MSSVTQFKNPEHLLIAILNYRTPDETIDCLRSLVDQVQAIPGTHVVVADNDSGDDSVEKIGAAIEREGWSDWATLMPLDRNGGYAFGNNAIFRTSLESDNPPPYFLLLNPDTQVRAGAVRALLDFLERNPKAGIAGSSFETQEGNVYHLAFRFPSLWSEMNDGFRLGIVSKLLSDFVVARNLSEEECEVDWLCGASLMIRREVFETAGLMDDDYFLYYEETDFCLSVKKAGWSCWYVPQSRVMHIGGKSTGVLVENVRSRLPQYWFESRRRYFVKNHGLLYTAAADALWIMGFSLWKIRQTIQHLPNEDPPQMLGDFILNSVFFRGGLPKTSS